jgi:hypothetical protein
MRPSSHATSSHGNTPPDPDRVQTHVVAIGGTVAAADVEQELRESLLRALADGAREIVLDLQGVDMITSSSRELVEAVGATLADRGGVLLALTGGQDAGEPYLMREIRGAAGDAPSDGSGADVRNSGTPRSRVE